MRSVNITRSWERAAERERPTALRAVEIARLEGFTAQRHELGGSVLIVCGGNAYGKSRLLRSLFRRDGGTALEFVAGAEDDGSAWIYLDPGLLVTRQMFSVSKDAAISERVDAAGFVRVKADVLRQLCYVLGNDYTAFETSEIDSDDPDSENLVAWGAGRDLIYAPEVIPYFRLTRDGRAYTSEAMSHGELIACTVIWALTRLDERSVVFIEEPDSALSPKSSGRCFDLVATYAHTRNLTIILTSHSATGLAHAPISHLALLKRDHAGVTSVNRASAIELRRELEVALEKRVLFVVEDAAGHQWLESLLADHFPGLSPLYEILVAYGEANVRKACSFPSEIEGFSTAICGVFDGDQRGANTKGQRFWAFLPGTVPPEELIRDYLLGGSARSDLGIDLRTAREAYATSAGDDVHDQLSWVASELGVSVPHLRSVVWDAYINTEQGQEEVRQLEAAVRGLPWGDDVTLSAESHGAMPPAPQPAPIVVRDSKGVRALDRLRTVGSSLLAGRRGWRGP
ncbi:hypothetical protein GCM10027425_28060 [Alteromonas gracilis]